MANASVKRIASQNEQAIRNLKLGMLISSLLSIFIRLLLRRSTLRPSVGSLAASVTYAMTFYLSRFLIRNGTPRRDSGSGELQFPGEDLNQPGMTEWFFDVLYITWACQVGSAIFGEWVWWLYSIIPLYAFYKLWSSVISPFYFGRSKEAASVDTEETETLSKRQGKLHKRGERGDPRVRTQTGKR